MGTKINFPLPNDKIWSKINIELEQFGTLPAPKAELILIQKKIAPIEHSSTYQKGKRMQSCRFLSQNCPELFLTNISR